MQTQNISERLKNTNENDTERNGITRHIIIKLPDTYQVI